MPADIKESHDKLLKSKEFLKKGYLCTAFIMCDPQELENVNWQFDYYNKTSDRITSYAVGDEVVVNEADSEVFKKEKTKVKELDLEKIKFTIAKAMKIVKEKIKSRKENTTKYIIILQNAEVTQ